MITTDDKNARISLLSNHCASQHIFANLITEEAGHPCINTNTNNINTNIINIDTNINNIYSNANINKINTNISIMS